MNIESTTYIGKRLEFLDSLRGFAAISVVIGHFIAAYGLPQYLEFFRTTPLSIFFHGSGAVTFFFILSGYVLSRKYFNQNLKLKDFNFIQYSINRVFRIYPLFIVALILSFFIINSIDTSINTIPQETDYALKHWNKIYNLKKLLLESSLFYRIPVDPVQRLVPQDWTLSIEIIISMSIPFLAFLCKTKPKTFFLFSLYLLLILKVQIYFFEFILGIYLAYYTDKLKSLWNNLTKFIKISILIIGILLYTSDFIISKVNNDILDFIFFNITAWGALVILIVSLCSKNMQLLLMKKPFIFMGKISFGIYLFHFIFIFGLVPFILEKFNMIGIFNENLLKFLLFLIVITGTIFLSWLTYSNIEIKFIKIGKKLSKKLINNKTINS